MADLKDIYVVHGAGSTCTHGIRESRIVLERTHGVFLKGWPQMNVNDCKPENIICFGGCYSMENPDTGAEAQKILEAVEKSCPETFLDKVMKCFTKQGRKESSEGLSQVVGICTPKILSAEWDNGGNTVEVNGEVPLLAGAKVHCLYGGEIEIIDSGQPEAGDMSQIEISPHSVPLSGSPGGNAKSVAIGAAAAGIAATPGMPKQAVVGMIGASKASGYVKKKEENTAVEEPRDTYVTSDQLTAMGWVGVTDSMVNELNQVLYKYEINTAERIRHFLAQAQHESGNGKILIERYNGNSPEEYFSKRDFRPEYEHNQTGDGAKYRGAGYMQLTWKATYRSFSEYVDDNRIVEDGVSYVADNYAWESSGWFWKFYKGLNEKVDSGYTVTQVTKVVNGGSNGLDERIANYNKAKEIIK